MSTIKADTVTTKSDDTDLTITGGGTGVPNLEAGFKVGGSAGVPTASIQDDAVTLAKMAAGTDGVIITYDASGNPVHVGPGTDGQVLTSTGAGSPPAFENAAGGGAWTLIGTSVASNSATLDQTGLDSTYDTYAIAFADMHPATDAVSPYLRFGDSSGIDSGASDYGYHIGVGHFSSNSYFGNAGSTDSGILMRTAKNVGNDTGEGWAGLVYLSRPGDGVMRPFIHGTAFFWNEDSTPIGCGAVIYGGRNAVITLDRVQFYFSSGNIESGRMTVWGIKHA